MAEPETQGGEQHVESRGGSKSGAHPVSAGEAAGGLGRNDGIYHRRRSRHDRGPVCSNAGTADAEPARYGGGSQLLLMSQTPDLGSVNTGLRPL
jgi:hypothetical protein